MRVPFIQLLSALLGSILFSGVFGQSENSVNYLRNLLQKKNNDTNREALTQSLLLKTNRVGRSMALTKTIPKDLEPVKVDCIPVHEHIKKEWLGMALNERYMAIDSPRQPRTAHNDTSFHSDKSANIQREKVLDFYVNKTFKGTQKAPANPRLRRLKRSKREGLQVFNCDYEVQWKDKGSDYYPRYIREAKCVSQRCYYDALKCIPKAFTANVLRRVDGPCFFYKDPSDTVEEVYSLIEDWRKSYAMSIEILNQISLTQTALFEEWFWEEIPIVFCCDCGHSF